MDDDDVWFLLKIIGLIIVCFIFIPIGPIILAVGALSSMAD